jgi:transcriptional regulator with GAF, ATPase, and Fis domain
VAKPRNQRVRRIIQKINELRKNQRQKIDILCNDMVSAHVDFIKKVKVLSFSVEFYETLLGQNDLKNVINQAAKLLKNSINESSIIIYLNSSESFEARVIDENFASEFDCNQLTSLFSPEAAMAISKSNQICNLDQMIALGLDANPSITNKISVAAVPVGKIGSIAGFILAYRNADMPLTGNELQLIAAITSGLEQVITACTNQQQKTEALQTDTSEH